MRSSFYINGELIGRALSAVFVLFISFSLSGNIILNQATGLRILDLVMLIGSLAFFLCIALKPFRRKYLVVFLLATYLLVFAIIGSATRDTSLMYSSIRCITALASGAVAGTILQNNRSFRKLFCLFGAVGALFVSWISLSQLIFPSQFYADFLPADAKMFWFDGSVRATGIWSHPNSLGQMQSIGTMLGLSFFLIPDAGRKEKWIAFILFFLTVTMTYSATQTRSYLISSSICLLIAMNFGSGSRIKGWIQLSSIFLVFILPFFARPLLGERWFGETASGQNALTQAGDRMETKIESLILILKNPFGYGFEGRLEEQLKATDLSSASHDAILSFTMTYGLIIGIFLVFVIISCLSRMLHSRHSGIEFFLPLIAVIIAFQFEDSLFSASMQMFLSVCFFSTHPPFFLRRSINGGTRSPFKTDEL